MIKIKLISIGLSMAIILAGCATSGSNYRPIIDTKNVDMNRYEVDLVECQQYAKQVAGAAQSAAVGAVAGAAFGAILAAAAGSRYDRGASARVGAIAGAAGAAADGEKSQRDIIRSCMSGRGYSVLQ